MERDLNLAGNLAETQYILIPLAVQAAEGMSMYGLSHVQHIWEREKDTRVLLAWSKTTVILSFRGTASFKNAKTDLAVSRSPAKLLFKSGLPC